AQPGIEISCKGPRITVARILPQIALSQFLPLAKGLCCLAQTTDSAIGIGQIHPQTEVPGRDGQSPLVELDRLRIPTLVAAQSPIVFERLLGFLQSPRCPIFTLLLLVLS